MLGVAVLASTFAALGGYTCATNFVAGLTPALRGAAALTATGALVVYTLPRRPHPTREPTDATLQPTHRSDPDNLASAVASATSPPR